ncbi:hypothetical protein VKI22_02205 [Cyanobacterium aponinum UTEX 3221]|uniref:hypothetical protein n=1 Tax=Cyanobacterium aponinum TaxID=379064 RepID=UPI002B4BBC20|nr:hypothetical protein [Cyanobacterium aponinum]WRL38928.1 hypothetical protein VKI22_02205 [Cyanobacterium aponinum UTEX 3221]
MQLEQYSLNYVVKSFLIDLIKAIDINNLHSQLSLSNLSLQLSTDTDSFVYKTPIFEQLKINSPQLKNLLTQKLLTLFEENYSYGDFKLKINSSHWLEIAVCDPEGICGTARILNQWLNNLSRVTKINIIKQKNNSNKTEKKAKFIYYYTHARCCSILTSAHKQNLIQLNNLDFKINNWYWQKTKDINFNSLNFYKGYESKLIRELVIIIDKIEANKINYLTSLENLTQKILDVEKHCRIWGKVLKNNKDISLARLALIMIALKYYQALIYAQFSLELPSEL